MITESDLERGVREAGESLPIPDSAIAAVLDAAAAPMGRPATESGRGARPRLRVGLVGLAAVAASAALVLGLMFGLRSQGPVVATGPDHATSVPPSPFGREGAATSGTAIPQSGTAGSSTVGGSSLPGSPLAKRPAKIASSGSLVLTVTRASLEGSVRSLGALARSVGGYVASTDLTQVNRMGRASVVLRVPAASFDRLVGQAERLGGLRSLTTANRDVTTQAADEAARLQALEDVRSQLQVLLRRTGRIADLLQVANQIESVGNEIDEVRAEQRALSAEVDYAALTVRLTDPAHAAAGPGPLARAWSAAVNGLSGGLRWLLSITGDVLFALLVLGVVLVGARLFYRHLWPRLRRLLL